MTFQEYIQDEKKRNLIEMLTSKAYYKNYKIQYGYEYEDVLQSVYLRLSKVFDSWNCKESELNTYVGKTIMSVISNLIDKLNSHKNFLLNKGNYCSLDYTISVENNFNIIDTVVSVKDIEECNDYSLNKKLVYDLVNSLDNENYKTILIMRLQGYTSKEIGEILGKTQQCVNSTINNAIKNIRKVNNIKI